eukprot:m51a1_g3241 hypothetical protein (533) ;mRNA; r:126549-128719
MDSKALKVLEEVKAGLLRERKLSLVLDLDHTLIHSSVDPEGAVVPSYADGARPSGEIVFRLQSRTHRVSPRPFLREFLREASQLFVIHLYTHGRRPYATKVVELIDDRKVFGDRIISAEDIPEQQRTKVALMEVGLSAERALALSDLVFRGAPVTNPEDIAALASMRESNDEMKRLLPTMGDETCAVVVDNDPLVWNFIPNLITVEPFVAYSGQQNAPPLAILGVAPSNADADDTLVHLLAKLRAVHKAYYESREQPSVADIVTKLKRQTFGGCNIVLSGIIPTNIDPKFSVPWKLLEEHGAACLNDVAPTATHVVAAKLGTEKLARAVKIPGVFIVNPMWLVEVAKSYNQTVEETSQTTGAVIDAAAIEELRSEIKMLKSKVGALSGQLEKVTSEHKRQIDDLRKQMAAQRRPDNSNRPPQVRAQQQMRPREDQGGYDAPPPSSKRFRGGYARRASAPEYQEEPPMGYVQMPQQYIDPRDQPPPQEWYTVPAGFQPQPVEYGQAPVYSGPPPAAYGPPPDARPITYYNGGY